LLLVAKTAVALTNLAKQLKARTMRRRYYAVVEGHVPLNEGTVRASIGRHARHRKEMAVRHLDGRTATTHYRVMRRYGPSPKHSTTPGEASTSYTVLDVTLETGRTHQIRVHMTHQGYPVIGDTTYGKRPASYWQALGVKRQLLHAYQLSFRHPSRGTPMTLSAPIPDEMKRWVEGAVISGQ